MRLPRFSGVKILRMWHLKRAKRMIRSLQILAVILGAIAAYFLWVENKDGVFVAVVLSASALFMSIRFQAKERLVRHEAESRDESE